MYISQDNENDKLVLTEIMKSMISPESLLLSHDHACLSYTDKDSAAAPSMVGNQSLSPDVAPCSPITIKITTTTKTFQYTPSQLPAMDSLNGFELNPGSNQMYSIAENPHEYEHGFGTNTSNTSNTSLLADQAFVE